MAGRKRRTPARAPARRRPTEAAARRRRSPPRGPTPTPTPTPAPAEVAPLLALSRELAQARTEDEITAALARALEALFPDRSFAIRLVDPRSLALRKLHARGRLRAGAPVRIALRRAAIDRTGLQALAAAGALDVVDADAPLFEGCAVSNAVPLAVGGQLFGVVNLEGPARRAGAARADARLLYQLANHAALGVRNVRSIEELTYLKTYLENLIEHANALVLVVNRSRGISVWNAALVRTTGFPRERALGGDLVTRVVPEDRPALAGVLLGGFAGEATVGHELRLLKAGGGDARIVVNTAPVVGPSGDVEDVIAIGQDLTLVRSLQAAAEHAERLAGIGRLVAGVVHELNNPLTAVTMYSDALVAKLSHVGHDPADLEKLRAIQESGQRIQRLARDLVAYARPSGARTEPVALADVVEEAARLAKPALKDRGATIEKRLAAAPPVEGSRSSLVQVVVNLVTNAAQAVGAGGKVTVSLAPDGDRVRLTVEDDGAGMPPDVAARAFEPFFTTRPASGIGLGLPIVQGIVARHGGSIAIESAPGEGTRVAVTLPVVRRGSSG